MATLLDPGGGSGYGTTTTGQTIPLNKYGLTAGSSADELIAAMKSDNTLQSVSLPGVVTTSDGYVVWAGNPNNAKPQSYYIAQGIQAVAADIPLAPGQVGSAVGTVFSKVGTAANAAADAAGNAAKAAIPWVTIAAVGALGLGVVIISEKL